MLTDITLKNIAIVRQLTTPLNNGLTVITGETGAGKSLLMSAIAMAFGGKAPSKEIIKTGASRARVELTFQLSENPTAQKAITHFLNEHVPEALSETLPDTPGESTESGSAETELLISREWTLSSSRCRINGTPVPKDIVKSLQPLLLDLHGQHDLTSLFQTHVHRDFLDGLGNNTLKTLKATVKATFHRWHRLQKELDTLNKTQHDLENQRDYLTYQLEELDNAVLDNANEDKESQTAWKRMSEVSALRKHLSKALQCLHGQDSYDESSSGTAASQGILDQLDTLSQALGKARQLDDSLNELSDTLGSHSEELRAFGDALTDYEANLSNDPEALAELSERIDLLETLKRKHGPTLSDVIAYQNRIRAELASLSAGQANQDALIKALAKAETELTQHAKTLTAERQQLAKKLKKPLLKILTELGLVNATFDVQFTEAPLSEHGNQSVEFQFSANPGEPLRALGAVASGGELSRFLLGLKVILAQHHGTPTLIFDEIDTGISGPTARAVAQHLRSLAEHAQVISITHQPLVAAAGTHHLHIEKIARPDDVDVVIHDVSGTSEKRKQVLSRLASGLDSADDETSRRFVDALLADAQQLSTSNV